MPLLRLDDIGLAYGHHPLLDHANLSIESGERVCLIGRNGEGKSSLLRIISGAIRPDSGQRVAESGLRIATLDQEVEGRGDETVYEVVASGLARLGDALAEYERLTTLLTATPDTRIIERMGVVQQELDSHDGWRLQQRVHTVLTELKLDAHALMKALSGGWRRRVMLARALVSDPGLLLLDEPTNHLDIEAILWLENFLTSYSGAVLFVSHDRTFLRKLATRIIELDRGSLTSWPGGYDDYLRRKADELAAEETRHALFDKRLSEEEAWIRQGIKARRTRNEGRVRALEAMRRERRERRERVGRVDMRLGAAEASGKLVFEAEHLDLSYGDTPVIRDFSVTVLRGERIALIGPNGVGKSTLLRALLSDLAPSGGTLKRGTKLEVAYFDQQREQLDPGATVMESVGGGKLTVTVGGQTQHVAGYLRKFLFPPERLRSPVSMLSGGERNRLLLARLFAQPANLLVLDEPTNDLDAETLELLEETLLEFSGTLLLVSHDRAFVDNVATSTWVFDGQGSVREYVGGYSDWRAHVEAGRGPSSPEATTAERTPKEIVRKGGSQASRTTARTSKRPYKEQREIDELPIRIEALEHEQTTLVATISAPGFYEQERPQIEAALERLKEIEAALAACYARWEALETPPRPGP